MPPVFKRGDRAGAVPRKAGPDFAREFGDYFRAQVNQTSRLVPQDGATRHLELHPSSFPYCPLRHVHRICTDPPADVKPMHFAMDFYVSVGKVVHTVVQTSLGYGRRMLGDWKCPHCAGHRLFSVDPECPDCGRPMEYQELGIRIGKRTVGHVDGVFQLSNGRYIVIDYKTTSTRMIETHRRTRKVFPYLHNKFQIRSYCYYLSRVYGLDIAGYLLVYLARDNIMEWYESVGEELTAADLEQIKQQCRLWDKQCDTVVRAKTVSDLTQCIADKPCRSHAHYMANYHDALDPCPLAHVCFDPKLIRQDLAAMMDHASAWLPLTTEPL